MERQAKDGVYLKVGPDEWQPVTRQAKDGTVYRKIGADSWLPQGHVKPTSKTESFARGAVQGATLGYADELSGGMEALWEKAKGNPEEFGNLYGQLRDESRANFNKAKGDNPTTYLGGEVAGGAATLAVPGMAAAKGAKLAGVMQTSARAGVAAGVGFSEGENVRDVLADGVQGGAIGMAIPAAGAALGYGGKKVIEKGSRAFVKEVAPTRIKLNESEILAAAERLGIKVTPGMLDDTGFVQRLEYTLAQSPSLLGQSVNRNQRAVSDKLAVNVGDLTKEASSLSPYQTGERFKSGVTAKVSERLDPISAVFNKVAESTKSIPVSDRSKDALVRNIQGLDTFKLTGGGGKPQQYVDMIGRLENADQVKTMMTLLNQDIASVTISGAEKHVLRGIKEKLSNLESNSITRAAVQQAREAGMGGSTGDKIGTQIVSDLKAARTEYRKLLTDLEDFSESASRVKTNKGPSAFLDSVEAIPSEKIQRNYFNTDNNRQLTALQEKFPEQFELLRQGKLKEIAEASVDGSMNGRNTVSSHKFLKEVNNLNPEAKAMVFKQSASVLDDMQTIQSSLPRNFNPSGSGTQAGWQDTIARNIKDIPTYLQYKAASSNMGRGLTEKLAKVREAPKLSESNSPRFLDRPATILSIPEKKRALTTADQKEEDLPMRKLKGREKWADEGFNKLLEDAPELEKIKGALLDDPKAKDLIIQASDLKPGSKAMINIVSKLKQKLAWRE